MRKISFLLPCRGRITQTRESIETLHELADDPSRFEVCARLDDDDLDSQKLFDEMISRFDNIKRFVGPRAGYHKLNVLYDESLTLSDSEADYVYVWGNDNVMMTDGWDSKLIERTQNDPAIVWPYKRENTLYYCFPVINKRWFELFGPKFPDNPFVDSTFYYTMKFACEQLERENLDVKKLESLSDLEVRHLQLNDEIHNEADKKKAPRPSKDQLIQSCREKAARLVKLW